MGRILEGKLEQRERSGVEGLTADTGHVANAASTLQLYDTVIFGFFHYGCL